MKKYKRVDELTVEEEIGEFLKHAPHRPGGLKHKVSTVYVKHCLNVLVGLSTVCSCIIK